MSTFDSLKAGGGRAGSGAKVAEFARTIGCDPLYLQAVLNVESGGDAYDAHGRLIILPEKHVFWRLLPKGLRNKARLAGLATPKWSRANYKGLGGKGSDARWDRLARMVALDEEAGLQSASYGKPQIMGFNYRLCGFESVHAFVLALAESEDAQDEAFIRYLVGTGLADALRAKDSKTVARRYNGAGQVARYAGMIDRVFTRLGGKRDVVDTGGTRARALRLGSDGYKVKALQEKLVSLGYHVVADGDFGPATRRQIVAFQADHGLKADGLVGPATEAALETAVPVTEQPGGTREDLTVKDLRERGSQTIKQTDRLKRAAQGVVGTGVAVEAVENSGFLSRLGLDGVAAYAGKVRSMLEPVFGWAADNKIVIAIVLAAIVWYVARRIQQRRLSDARQWRHVG